MSPLQLMELHKDSFTPNDLLIYNHIIKDPGHVSQMTTSALAEECGVSQPALTRFIKTLGYARYQDFRGDLIAYLAQSLEQEAEGTGHMPYFNTLYQVIGEAENILSDEYMRELVRYISGFDRVFASGIAKSFQPALLLQTLTIKNRNFIMALPRETLPELCDALTARDLLILFSVSGKPEAVQIAASSPCTLFLVTANPDHPYKKEVDRELVFSYVPPSAEDSSVSPVLFDIFVELLASYLTQK